MIRIAMVLLLGVPLFGCGSVDEGLSQCLSSTEQTVLLRQLTLPTKEREFFDECRQTLPRNYCTATYLDANGLARKCMKARGYTEVAPVV